MKSLFFMLVFFGGLAQAKLYPNTVFSNVCPDSIKVSNEFSATLSDATVDGAAGIHTHGKNLTPASGTYPFEKIEIVSNKALPLTVPPISNNVTGGFHCKYQNTTNYLWRTLHNSFACSASGNKITCTHNH